MNELPPFFSISSILAFITGSDGTLNGRRHIIRTDKVSPGTSTPSQNESVAKRTLFLLPAMPSALMQKML